MVMSCIANVAPRMIFWMQIENKEPDAAIQGIKELLRPAEEIFQPPPAVEQPFSETQEHVNMLLVGPEYVES